MQDTPSFWNFSLRIYAAPGVADVCLDLQDRFGFDVNTVLYLLWQGQRRRQLTTREIETVVALVQDWQLHVVRPLRGARRFLRDPGPMWSSPQVSSLRQRLKEEELLAERLQQDVMEVALPDPGEGAGVVVAAKANCEAYARILRVELLPQHLSTLLTSLTPDP